MSVHEGGQVLDVVIVGCGAIAGGFDEGIKSDIVKTHAGAYTAHPGFRMAACVEPDEERRKSFMSLWSIDQGFADMADFVKSGMKADVASMCVPTDLHDVTLQALLDAPVGAVFCEKPISGNGETSARLVSAYEAAKKPLAVNYFRRWDRKLQSLAAEIASGAWGRLQNAVGTYTKGTLNCGSHMIDLFHFMTQEQVTATAVLKRRDDYGPDDPTVDAVLKTASGAPVYLVGASHQHFFTFELDLTFEKGRIGVEDLGRTLRLRRVVADPDYPQRWTLPTGQRETTEIAQAMVCAVGNVYDHLTKGVPLASDGTSALQAEMLCHELIAMAGELEEE